MRDILEAIEQQSAVLSFRIEKLARARGWGTRPHSWLVSPVEGKLVIIVATMLHLPASLSASFTPRREPEPDGKSWIVDVRRGDSVVKPSFADGIRLAKEGGKFTMTAGGAPLTDELLAQMLEDLGSL